MTWLLILYLVSGSIDSVTKMDGPQECVSQAHVALKLADYGKASCLLLIGEREA